MSVQKESMWEDKELEKAVEDFRKTEKAEKTEPEEASDRMPSLPGIFQHITHEYFSLPLHLILDDLTNIQPYDIIKL